MKHQSRKGIDWQYELMPQDVNTDGDLNFLTLIMSITQLRTSHWSIPMAKMYIVGTYSSAALKGFVTNPAQDRKQIVEAMTASTGIRLDDFQITRGIFDFVAVAEGTIEQAMAIKIAVGSTGSFDQFHILESIDISKAATLAQTTLANYVPPQG